MTETGAGAAAASTAEGVSGLVSELLARDRWPRERVLAHREEHLRALLRHAVEHSPYYREAMGDADGVDLEALPTLPKATLVAEYDRIVTDPRLRLEALEAHLAGPDPGGRLLDRYRAFATSGTTGLRAVIPYTAAEFSSWVAATLRTLARVGIGPATRLVSIGAPSPLHITKQLFADLPRRPDMPQLSVNTPLDEMVEALNAYQPEAAIGYASVFALLAEEQLEGRLRIRPRVVGVSSEVLVSDARERVERAWSISPTSVYASTEVLILASSAPAGIVAEAPLETCDDLAVIEVVDEQNRPVPPGVPGHKVLVTNLVNRTLPLIRYELSDSVTPAAGPNPYGRPYGLVASVDGRNDDVLRLPAKDGGTLAVNPYRLRTPFASTPWVRQYQIVHADDGLHTRVVLRGAAPADAAARIRDALVAELEDAGVLPPPVSVEPVAAIEREPGPAAKVKLVKSTRTRELAATP